MKNWNPKQISFRENSSPISSDFFFKEKKNFSSYKKIKNSRLVNFKSLSVIQKVWNHYKQFFRSEKKTKILFFLRGFGYMSDRILGIGFSSVESKKLFKSLEMSGIKPVEIIESGFFFKNTYFAGKNPNQKKKILTFLDLFRGRIIIPIRNEIGLVVAFGGRVLLRNKLPKYFNSSDWGIFKKKRIVFSEDFNRNPFFYRSELTILVEGYLDSFIFFQNGIRFSNANLGTGISSYQLFKSGVTNKNSHLLFFFDSDLPGKKGVQNSFLKFKNLLELNFFNINVASIPGKNFLKDPDEVLYYKGSFLLTVQILNKALPIPFWVEDFVCKDLLSQDKPEIFLDRILNFFSTPYSGFLIFKFFFLYIDTRSVKWMNKTNNFFLGQTGSIQPYIKANKKKLPESNFSNFKKFHQIQTYPKNSTFLDFQILSQKKMLLLSFYYYKIREDVSQVCIPNNFFFFSPSNYFSQIRFSNLIFDFGLDFNSRIFEIFSEKLIFGLEKKESINLIEKRLGLDNEISRILPDVSSTIDVFLAKIAIYFSKKEKKKNSQKIKKFDFSKKFLSKSKDKKGIVFKKRITLSRGL